jgi:DNA-binding MarR family transcriptional regulator
MKLETEIHQVKFRNEFHKLAVDIIYTYGWLMNKQASLFDKYHITPNQFNVLRILRGQYPNPATVNLLKERMLDKMSDASRLVERLRVKGMVKRETAKDDRRRVDVSITEKGMKLLSELDKLNEAYDSFFSSISEKEAQRASEILDKLRS